MLRDRMRRLVPILLALLVVAGCGGDDDKKKEAEATAAPSATAAAETGGCQKVDTPKPKDEGTQKKPTLDLDPRKTYTAVVKTSCGDFSIALDVKRAPRTTGSFVALAKSGFYDNTTFHRISPGFVIQGGDPLGTGQGGPGYSVEEAPPSDLTYARGVVAMAKTGAEPPGTSGSQFFVVTADSGLPPDYALLGKIASGDEAVDAIATTPTDPSTERPLSPVVIDSISIQES